LDVFPHFHYIKNLDFIWICFCPKFADFFLEKKIPKKSRFFYLLKWKKIPKKYRIKFRTKSKYYLFGSAAIKEIEVTNDQQGECKGKGLELEIIQINTKCAFEYKPDIVITGQPYKFGKTLNSNCPTFQLDLTDLLTIDRIKLNFKMLKGRFCPKIFNITFENSTKILLAICNEGICEIKPSTIELNECERVRKIIL